MRPFADIYLLKPCSFFQHALLAYEPGTGDEATRNEVSGVCVCAGNEKWKVEKTNNVNNYNRGA